MGSRFPYVDLLLREIYILLIYIILYFNYNILYYYSIVCVIKRWSI